MKLVFCFVFFLWEFISAQKIPPNKIYLVETTNKGLDEDGHKFFEGDMVLNANQRHVVRKFTKDRAGEMQLAKKWPDKTFRYEIADELANVPNVMAAIQNWGNNTCIDFEEAGPDDRSFARFQAEDGGCNSWVGYQRNEQEINLGPGCQGLGTIEHEIGHALGLFHEQSRNDRDKYVTVLRDNVNTTFRNNFLKEPTLFSHNISYDLDSVMHSGPDEFAINDGNTLVTKNPLNHFRIGQRNGMSFDDVKLVNLMYKCSENCVRPPRCRHDGYINEKCACVCPPGTSGRRCQRGKRTYPVHPCLHDLTTTGTIASPGFPNNIKAAQCVWRITAPETQKVRITFRSFAIRPPLDATNHPDKANWCYYDYLELRLDNLISGPKSCGTQLNNEIRTSTGNVAVLVFERNDLNFPGFVADVEFVN